MSNQVFHFSNTGISSGQRFYLKDDVSGIFLRNLIINSNFPVLGSNLIYTTGNQTISGVKDFTSRPTVNTVPVAVSGDATSSLEQYVKNGQGGTVYKGQPVYVGSSNGNNILVKLSSNTGELTSSKTFGLLKQDLLVNEFGYVVTEGPLLNVNTNSANDGDSIWLGPTGNLIFGFANKPQAPQHLVYLGFVERAHPTQGKIFVKVQNGFEIDELHDVRIINKQNSDIIIYNSGSGLWLNSGINFGAYATVNNLALTGSTNAENIASTGSTLQSQINNLEPSILILGSANHNPASGTATNYYISTIYDLGPVTNTTLRDFVLPSSGKIIGVFGVVNVGGAISTSPASATFALYNKNTTASQSLITGGLLFNKANSVTGISDLNIDVAPNTPYLIQVATPGFVGFSAPTTVRYSCGLWIK
jgi:hypothetical protein